MNTESGDKLKLSAETQNINLLYEVLRDDPSILENIDKIQFVETPLHIAASRGYLEFAIEIMNLKPSFATKLNLQGYSPIHHAMESLRLAMVSGTHDDVANKLRRMVSNFVGINKDLVRVKGREGLTPLHFASQYGEVELLTEFITACPDSIEDVTVRGESALHIAVLKHQYEALQVLVGWLKRNSQRGARELEKKILNHEDHEGNTVLHISAHINDDPKFLRFLIKSGIKLNTENSENQTALDLAKTPEIKKILMHAKAKLSSEVDKIPTRAEELRSKTTITDTIVTWVRRMRSHVTEEQRSTWLVVATLLATVTYESALSPPGGVFQVSASDDNNVKVTSTDGFFSTRGNAGKSILSRDSFMVFSLGNMLSFSVSILAILILTPGGPIGRLVLGPVGWFAICYVIAIAAISPTRANTTILYIPAYLSVSIVFSFLSFSMVSDKKRVKKLR